MSAPAPSPKKLPFFLQHILPVLFIFLIPAFALWFFNYAERDLDRNILADIEQQLGADKETPAAEKNEILAFYRRVPVSRIMASTHPEAAQLQATLHTLQTAYANYRWMKRVAWTCLGTIAATLLIAGVSVALSLRSHAAQYYALRIGWPVLRTSAAIQVLGQGVLAVALSYWVTAVFVGGYYPKIILVIAGLALCAVIALCKAIFAKVDNRCEANGELVGEEEAPALWARLRSIAARLGTEPPDRVIVGVEPSFFVTEHPITLGTETHNGRSLYLSLPLLRVLARDEADGVLGHELAHFSGQDTLWSRKITPLTSKFALYMQTLATGLSLVVAHFIFFFWKLYGLSISKLSRAREFRADRIGAECSSPTAMKRALVKVTSYCDYRATIESDVLEKERVDCDLNLAATLEHGYPAFLSAFVSNDQSVHESVPHPFDTHPTLSNRVAELGFDAREALSDAAMPQTADQTWYGDIKTALAIEERLWSERQQLLQSCHTQDLAWRLLPDNDEEKAFLAEHFPRTVLRNKKGKEATLEFDRIQLSGWDAPILFSDIFDVSLQQALPKQQMTLVHKKEGRRWGAKAKFQPAAFTSERGDLLTLFGLYYSRHKTAEARRHLANAAAAAAGAPA